MTDKPAIPDGSGGMIQFLNALMGAIPGSRPGNPQLAKWTGPLSGCRFEVENVPGGAIVSFLIPTRQAINLRIAFPTRESLMSYADSVDLALAVASDPQSVPDEVIIENAGSLVEMRDFFERLAYSMSPELLFDEDDWEGSEEWDQEAEYPDEDEYSASAESQNAEGNAPDEWDQDKVDDNLFVEYPLLLTSNDPVELRRAAEERCRTVELICQRIDHRIRTAAPDALLSLIDTDCANELPI